MLLLLACADNLTLDSKTTDTGTHPPDPLCVAIERPPDDADVRVERIFADVSLRVPVALIQAPGDADHLYVVEKRGRVTRLSLSDDTDVVQVLDISGQVYNGYSESGLLGVAFHPQWPKVPEIYANYTSGSYDDMVSHVVRFRSDDGLSFGDEDELLRIDQPYANHNGGHVLFGPDGYLYLGLGDGGSANDPLGYGQDTSVLLGKMLRIDVDSGDPYGIPADNPFADGVDGRAEIYAWGLRNPWRYSFDSATGELWVADVGQDAWEEVDIVERGGNYGWDAREGTHCKTADICEDPDLIDPVLEYAHGDDGASIVGGHVYRGTAIPSLQGRYLYADTVFGSLFVGTPDPVTGALVHTPLIESLGFQPTSFGVDVDEELYLLGYTEGGIYKIVPGEEDVAPSDFPTLLSETGCARPSRPEVAVDSMVPYTVNVQLWSDDAEKERWFTVPDGEEVTVDEGGDFFLPQGSVVRKDFIHGGVRVETRLLMHDSQGWAGYSYAWDGHDATLLAGAAVGADAWVYPSRGDCLRCHTSLSGQTLGLELAQVDRDEQVDAWAPLLSAIPDVDLLPELDSDAPVADRARAYLHANCASCHQPEGVAGVQIDLRYSTPFAETGLCNVAPQRGDLGLSNPLLLAPGAAETSVIYLRIVDEELERMPPLGSEVVDTEGASVIANWIRTIDGC